jgi:hypothetical protein
MPPPLVSCTVYAKGRVLSSPTVKGKLKVSAAEVPEAILLQEMAIRASCEATDGSERYSSVMSNLLLCQEDDKMSLLITYGRRSKTMDTEKVPIVVSSLTGEEVDVDAFIADVKKLATERGLAESDIEFEVEEMFPVEGAILILLGLASKVAYDVWKEFVLPRLKEKYKIEPQEPAS